MFWLIKKTETEEIALKGGLKLKCCGDNLIHTPSNIAPVLVASDLIGLRINNK